MKKIIMIFILLVTMNCFAETKVVDTFYEIPEDLRGVWIGLRANHETKDVDATPLCHVTSRTIKTMYHTDVIVMAEAYSFSDGPGYILYAQNPSVKYLIIFYNDTPDYPMVYIFENGEETFRSCILIRGDE